MTKNRDIKRLTRARMDKTGESYTTARQHLLDRADQRAPEPSSPSPADFAALAGMSDEAIEAKTGCTWGSWVIALDDARAAEMSHREIAAHVQETSDVSGWWAQTVTVGYERIKGLRAIGQRRDGSYEANKSKTFAVPMGQLYAAWADEEIRRRWLPDVELTVRMATPEKSMRLTWSDDTAVDLYFTAGSAAKSQVAIQHRKLASKEKSDELKAYWGERLTALAELLAEP